MPEDVPRPLARRRRAEATALPAWIKPQLTKPLDQAPDGSEWLHEGLGATWRGSASTMRRGRTKLQSFGLRGLDHPIAEFAQQLRWRVVPMYRQK